MKKLLFLVGLASVLLATKSFAILSASVSAPGSVNTGAGFTVGASGSDDFGEIDVLTLYGPSGYLGSAYPDSWNRYSVSMSVSQTAPGSPTTLGYTAYLDTDSYSTSGSASVSVVSTNQAPTITWVTNPSYVAVNQSFTVQAKGMDADGNLTNVFVWREWTPFAFNGGGNGYENTSDGNGYSQSYAGDITFQAQAQDINGATSAVITWVVHVYVPNNAPSIEWHTVTASAYMNQYFTTRAHGHDSDGNLAWVNVWRDMNPFAYNGGGDGYDSVTDNNGVTPTIPGTTHFTAQAGDSAGATTGVIDYYTTLINRVPVNPTITPSGPVTNMGGNQYYMWLGDSINLASTVHDDDGNLVHHQFFTQRVTGANPTGAWIPISDDVPSNGTDSSKTTTYTPNQLGRWDFNMGADDGVSPAIGNSITVYVYGQTNGATFNSQSVDTSPMALGSTRTVSVTYLNSGDKPWMTDGTPHRLGSANTPDNTWGLTRIGLDSGETILHGETKTFTFTITAPTTPGTYNFQWKMVEDGIEWFGDTSPNMPITVVDVTAPTTPTGLSSSNLAYDSFTLNWSPSSDNIGVTGYEVYKNGALYATTTGTSCNVTGLSATTAYSMSVRARDAAGNWSAQSATLSVTTPANPNQDDDGDGIPNGWESAHGLNPSDPNDAKFDSDGDGLTNVAEYNLGTDPHVANAGSSTVGGSVPSGWPSAGGSSSYAVGATTGTLDVDKSGAANYSIPLGVTPGTAGLQPQLSLNYSSQAGSGIAGFGWSLGGVSAITRGGQTLASDNKNRGISFTVNDRFYLDGQRLVYIGGGSGYGTDGAEYRTEIDSMSKVISHGSAGTGPSWFEVKTKAGLTIEFGHTTDSAFEGQGRSEVLTWSVSRIADTKHNYMTFSYYEDTSEGEQRLTRIDYTGNSDTGLTPYASVQFTYEARADTFHGFVAGSKTARTQRLKKIGTYYGSNLAKEYIAEYTERANTGRSIMTSLRERASDGREYAPLTFNYDQTQAGWNQLCSSWGPPALLAQYSDLAAGQSRGTGFVDLDGDGRPDFVQYRYVGSDIQRHAWLNKASGWVAAEGSGGQPDYRPPAPLTDPGARFVDVNGDGLPDFFSSDGTVYLNTGSGFSQSTTWSIPVPPSYSTVSLNFADYQSSVFIDFDADGRVDFTSKVNISYMQWDPNQEQDVERNDVLNVRWHNNGSGWTYEGQPPPFDMDKGARFVDVNGDGLPDQVQNWYGSNRYYQGVALANNNGASFDVVVVNQNATSPVTISASNATRFLPPELLNVASTTGGGNSPIGTEIVDVNGDGMPDLVSRNDAGGNYRLSTYFNTGNGWVLAPSAYQSPLELTHDNTPQGVAFLDINTDGIPDVVQAWDTSGRDVRLGSGHGWSSTVSAHGVVRQIAQSGRPVNGTDFVDLNGDGAIDEVWNWQDNTGSPVQGAALNLSVPADRLISITNAFGVSASITYAPLTERDGSGNTTVYDVGTGIGANGTAGSVNITSPMQVVKSVSHDDGTGGQYAVTYRYGGLRAERIRGSLGFEWMKVTDGRSSIASKTTFMQAYPYIGSPAATETRTGGNTLLSEATITYATKSLNSGATVLPYASSSRQKAYELNGGTLVSDVLTTTAEPDAYGNVTSITVSDQIGGFTKATASNYTNDTSNWFLGRLTSSTVTASATGKATQSRSSSFTYNANGLLETETVEPGNSLLSLTTTYGYDGYGNKTSVTLSGSGVTSRTTTTAYDSQGRLPISSTNALNQTETYGYSGGYSTLLGVMTSLTGPNSLTTTWTYDSFGAKTEEHRADGAITFNTVKWAGSGGLTPGGAKYQIETRTTDSSGTVNVSPPSIVFYDSFGRSFHSLAIDGNGQVIHQATTYDNMGRAYATSIPYREGQATVYWTQTTSYDLLSRPLEVHTPDEQASGGIAITTFSYGASTGAPTTSATDAKGRVAVTVKNSQGWTVTNTRNQNAGSSANDYTQVTYDYDAYGNLTSTTAAGVTTTLGYDNRGRKTSMVDPDMGTWTYGYNVFGELTSQVDAKSQTTTLSYDQLGRLVGRVEPLEPGAITGTTTWTYDTAPKDGGGYWIGKLYSVSSPSGSGTYSETYDYGDYGRPRSMTRVIGGITYTFNTEYDSYGRVTKTRYPTVNGHQFTTRNVYNGLGYLKEIREDSSSKLYWQADSYNVDGKIDGETYGNGLTNDRIYSLATGRLLSANIDRGAVLSGPYQIQQMSYTYDSVGNVLTRADSAVGRGESFGYDGLDRLTTHNLLTGAGSSVTTTFDQKGNITSKSDAATSYAYYSNRPHAVQTVSGGALGSQTYHYDANGNMTDGGGRTITWTSFNQVASITKGSSYYSNFTFGAAHERVKQVSHLETTIYVGSLFEQVTSASSGVTEYKHYIMSPTGRVAIYTDRSNFVQDTRFYHTDGLGSITAVSDEKGAIVQRFAFDAWGKRINPATGATMTGATRGSITRGYTDHEQLDDLGLVHMNGRIYDPLIGRFLSADPTVDGAHDAQGYNRYSYVGNNPMNATDPSGYFKLSLKEIITIVAVVVISYFTYGAASGWAASFLVENTAMTMAQVSLGAAVAGGAAAGFASSFAGSLLNGASIGSALQSGLVGAAAGAVTSGLLSRVGALSRANKINWFERGLAHGVVQGGGSEVTGGDFRHGFISGFAVGASEGEIGDWARGSVAKGVTAAAVVGGTATAIGGGKFANGAISGAFSFLFNWASQRGASTVHQRANANNLGDYLSDYELAIVDQSTIEMDEDQSSAGAYKHAMRDLDAGQTVDAARAAANDYVRGKITYARALLKAGDWGGALREYGYALHTLQDSTSPMHAGFQGWREKWTSKLSWGFYRHAIPHGLGEMYYPGDNSSLARITRDSYYWFKTGDIPKGDLFSIYKNE